MYNVQEIENEEEFDAIILSAEDKLVAVDFSAEWCGPCKMIGPYFAQLSLQYTNVIFLKVDVDKVKPVAQKHGISAMPTFLFFKNQQKVHEFKGANPDNLNRALQSLTGGVAQSAPAEPPKPASPYKNFPCNAYVYSDVAKLDMVIEKAIKFNDTIKTTNADLSLSNTEIANLRKMANTLKNVSMYHSSNFSTDEYAVIEKLLLWSPAERFPGLDILRLAVMHPEASKYYASTGMINMILSNLSEKQALYANVLMSLRFLVNTFKYLSFRQNLLQFLPKVVAAIVPHLSIDKKDGKIALATIFLNYAVLITSEDDVVSKVSANDINLLVTPLLEMLKKASSEEEEVNMRNIIALGTILYGHSQYRNQYINAVNAIPNSESAKFQEAKKELSLLVTSQAPAPKVTPSIPLRPANTAAPSPAPMPNPWSGLGNMPNMPNMPPGFPTPNPDMMQRLAQSPELMSAMQNPSLMNKLMEVARDPSKISQYQSDPEFMQLLMKLNSMMQ